MKTLSIEKEDSIELLSGTGLPLPSLDGNDHLPFAAQPAPNQSNLYSVMDSIAKKKKPSPPIHSTTILDHSIWIICKGKGSKSERTQISTLSCSVNETAVEGFCGALLRKLGVSKPLGKFSFGFRNGSDKMPSTAILNWNIPMDEINEDTVFTLIERDEVAHNDQYTASDKKSSKAVNKEHYTKSNQQLAAGETAIRTLIDPMEWMQMKRRCAREVLRAKYRIVCDVYFCIFVSLEINEIVMDICDVVHFVTA